MKKRYLWYLPALLLLLPPLTYRNSELVLFPVGKNVPAGKKYKITTYTDTADSESRSSCTLAEATDSSLVFDFILRKVHGDPYAGFSINLFRPESSFTIYPYGGFMVNASGSDGFVNIALYDSLCIDVVTKNVSYFEVQFKTFIENLTEKDDFRTCHTSTCLVPVDINIRRYAVPLADFKLAYWWQREINRKYGRLAGKVSRKPDFTKLFGINFQGGVENPENEQLRFAIEKIAFVKKPRQGRVTMTYGVCLAAYIAAVFLTGFFFGKSRSRRNGDAGRVAACLNARFRDPEITAEQVGKETGMSPQRVETILRRTFKTTVGDYVKRLKKERSAQQPKPCEEATDALLLPVPPDITDLLYQRLETVIRKKFTQSELTLDDVAREVAVSPPRITKILQQKTSMTFPQYLNDVRIAAAKKLLISTALPISEIGYNVGYFNIPHFNRVFNKNAGCSPGEFREMNKNVTGIGNF